MLNILIIFPSSAQGFEFIFGSPADDRARALQQLADGSIYVAGFSNAGPNGDYDITITKLSSTGSIQWTKFYGKQIDEYTLFMNKTSDNALILCGESHSSLTGVDAWIMKIDSSGAILWLNGIATPVNESFKYIEETADGGFITCGFQSDNSGSNDILIAKTDSLGDILWQKNYGGTDNDYADAIKQTSDGGYLISADSRSFGLPDYDIYMLKIDSAGNFEWDNLSGGPFADGCQGFIITSGNEYLTFGESIVDLALPYQYFLQLADSAGNIIWEKTMGGLGTDAAFSAVETTDGGFIITGYSNSNDINSPIDLVVFKINHQGDSLWSHYYGDTGIDIGYHIIPCIGGGFLVAGTTWNNDNDYYLLKISDLGLVSVSEKENRNLSLKIFPNPAINNFTVELPELITDPMVFIFTKKGEKIFSKNFYENLGVIEVETNLDPGIYFINVQGENKSFTTKLVIQ